MTHEKTRRRISRTNLEFSLASLGRDNLSKQSSNELHQEHTFYHAPISNRLDPKTYQLFTKSPNLRADVDGAIYTTSNTTETTQVHNINEFRKFLNSQQENNTEVFQFCKERPFPHLYNSSISSSQSSLNKIHTSQQKASTFDIRSRSQMDDFEHLDTASVGLSVQQQPRSTTCANKQIYILPLEDVIKNKWNEQRSSVNEIQNELKDTETLADSIDSATKTLSNRFTSSKKEFSEISSKPQIVLSSYIDEKINDKYMDNPIEYLPLDSETNNQSEAYYLDDGLRTMVNFRHGKETFQETHRILHPCPSNPNRMNGSYRHDLNRKNSSINAIQSCTALNIYSSSNNNTFFSPNVNLDKHFHHDKGLNLSDDLCNQGRFSPNQDHGYATLVSPSPTNHNTNTTQGIILYPPTSTKSPDCRNVMTKPLLWKKRSPFRTGPYFERLSDKVLLKIFNWLNSCDLCNVSRVCKRFNQIAWHPTLWREILLKGERINGDKALKMIFRKLFSQTCSDSCAEIERVMLSFGCKISDKGLLLLMRRCPLLTHLQLQNCVELSNQSLINVLVKCTNLQHLDVMGCTQITTIAANPDLKTAGRLLLQYLDVTDCIGIDDVGLKIIVKSFPHLIYLYLRRCIRITDAGFKFIPSFCITLKELSVSDCVNITDFGIYELAKLGPALRYLSVAKCDRVSDAGLKVIARRCYKLRYLNARGCEAVSDDSITVLARSCPRLRALDIGKCEVSDAGLRTLAESCPNLKKLSLKNCDMITDHGVQCIAYYCRGLQQLNIQDCQISVQGYRAVKKYCKRCIIEHTNPGFC